MHREPELLLACARYRVRFQLDASRDRARRHRYGADLHGSRSRRMRLARAICCHVLIFSYFEHVSHVCCIASKVVACVAVCCV